MAKSTDVVALASAALKSDKDRVISICKIIMANEKNNSTLKEQLNKLVQRSGVSFNSNVLPTSLSGLILHSDQEKSLSDLVLADELAKSVKEFFVEKSHLEELRSFGLPTSSRILLSGPPGNGKTSLAGVIAKELELPLLTMDFSKVISSHLGETGNKIAKVFRGVSDFPCVLFIDEMETVLSERGGQTNKQDVGEIARVVSALLLEIDRLPENVILVGATNHIEMLDRAVIRRFNHHWELEKPSNEIKVRWIENFAKTVPGIPVLNFDIDLQDLSMSDLEKKTHHFCKRWVIENSEKLKTVFK